MIVATVVRSTFFAAAVVGVSGVMSNAGGMLGKGQVVGLHSSDLMS